MYEKLIGRAEETGADMVGCDYCLTDEHSMKIGKRVENGKAEQNGVLGNKQCRSLIFRQRKPCCKGLSPGNFHGQRHPLSGAHFLRG